MIDMYLTCETKPLAVNEILESYDAVSQLYPFIPSLSLWRAWEYAAYRRYTLPEPVLDIGCGDGRFFRLVWPEVRDVTGVDADPAMAALARRSGVYRQVLTVPAHQLPDAVQNFASAFANCSLEHMDQLPDVLASIYRSLRPRGSFLFSAVTDRFLEWAALPLFVSALGEVERAEALRARYQAYHHLINPLPLSAWVEHLGSAGFEILEHIPIVPEMTSRLFLFLDHLWHLPRPAGELGNELHAYLAASPNFPQAFRQVLAGVLQMERDWSATSGVIFLARRPL